MQNIQGLTDRLESSSFRNDPANLTVIAAETRHRSCREVISFFDIILTLSSLFDFIFTLPSLSFNTYMITDQPADIALHP